MQEPIAFTHRLMWSGETAFSGEGESAMTLSANHDRIPLPLQDSTLAPHLLRSPLLDLYYLDPNDWRDHESWDARGQGEIATDRRTESSPPGNKKSSSSRKSIQQPHFSMYVTKIEEEDDSIDASCSVGNCQGGLDTGTVSSRKHQESRSTTRYRQGPPTSHECHESQHADDDINADEDSDSQMIHWRRNLGPTRRPKPRTNETEEPTEGEVPSNFGLVVFNIDDSVNLEPTGAIGGSQDTPVHRNQVVRAPCSPRDSPPNRNSNRREWHHNRHMHHKSNTPRHSDHGHLYAEKSFDSDDSGHTVCSEPTLGVERSQDQGDQRLWCIDVLDDEDYVHGSCLRFKLKAMNQAAFMILEGAELLESVSALLEDETVDQFQVRVLKDDISTTVEPHRILSFCRAMLIAAGYDLEDTRWATHAAHVHQVTTSTSRVVKRQTRRRQQQQQQQQDWWVWLWQPQPNPNHSATQLASRPF